MYFWKLENCGFLTIQLYLNITEKDKTSSPLHINRNLNHFNVMHEIYHEICLLPSGNKPLPEPKLTQICVAIWCPSVSVNHITYLSGLEQKWYSLQWCHNEHDGVSNHQPHDCLLKHWLRRRSKKTSKLRVTGLCEGNSPVTGEFPAQRASNPQNVSIWWRHHAVMIYGITQSQWVTPLTWVGFNRNDIYDMFFKSSRAHGSWLCEAAMPAPIGHLRASQWRLV